MEELRQRETEEFLRLYRTIRKKERELVRRLEELEAYDGYGSVPLDGMPRGASVAKDAIIVEKRQDLRIALMIIQALAPVVRGEVEKVVAVALDDLDLLEKRVASRRFVDDMSYYQTLHDLKLECSYIGMRRIKAVEAEAVRKIRESAATGLQAQRGAEELIRTHWKNFKYLILEGHLAPVLLLKIDRQSAID